MLEVIVKNLSPIDSMMLARQLERDGLVKGQDFDWRFCPEQWIAEVKPLSDRWLTDVNDVNDIWIKDTKHLSAARHTVFMFHTEAYALLYSLKWA